MADKKYKVLHDGAWPMTHKVVTGDTLILVTTNVQIAVLIRDLMNGLPTDEDMVKNIQTTAVVARTTAEFESCMRADNVGPLKYRISFQGGEVMNSRYAGVHTLVFNLLIHQPVEEEDFNRVRDVRGLVSSG